MSVAIKGPFEDVIGIAHLGRDSNVGIQTVVLFGVGAVLGKNPVGEGFPVGITDYPVGFGLGAVA